MRPEVFVEVQRDLAVRTRAETVAALFQFATLALEVVELAVHDDAEAFVLVGDGLVAGRQVDDTQTRVAKADAMVRRNPNALLVGPAVNEAPDRAVQRVLRGRLRLGEQCSNATHGNSGLRFRVSGHGVAVRLQLLTPNRSV